LFPASRKKILASIQRRSEKKTNRYATGQKAPVRGPEKGGKEKGYQRREVCASRAGFSNRNLEQREKAKVLLNSRQKSRVGRKGREREEVYERRE